MIYYKVPKELDGKQIYTSAGKRKSFYMPLVAQELFTEKECERYSLPKAKLVRVEVPKSRTHWLFGARFEFGIPEKYKNIMPEEVPIVYSKK